MSLSPQTAPVPGPYPDQPPGRPRLVPAPERRRPNRWRTAAIVAAAILAFGGLYLLLRKSPAADTGGTAFIRTGQVTTGPIERIVRISGQTSARKSVIIMVPVFRGPDSGRDLTLMKVAKPGALVKKGDLVAELDPQSLRDHIDDMNDTVMTAENDVQKKQADQEVEWEALQQKLRVAKADYDKAQLDLKAAEVKTEIERELLKLTADEAGAAYKRLQGDVATTRAANRAEIRMMEITVQRHKIHRNNHLHDLERFTMRAPMDGLVVMMQTWRGGEMRQIQEGDQVFPGQQFMKIVDPSTMQLEAVVSQADSSEFRVGQEALVGLDAFPGLQFRGSIYSIGALAVKGMWDTYYIRNVPVKVLIDGRDTRLIPDLSAWAHIRIARQEQATVVPAEALRNDGMEEVVYVGDGRKFQKRAVDVGIRTPTLVSILEGVRPGERVALGAVK